MRHALLVFLCGYLLLGSGTNRAFAQGETTSAIAGQVNDASGAPVPQASITVTNNDTGLKRIAVTDDSGRFTFPQLRPGTYTVRVEAHESVSSALGQTQSVNFILQIAQSHQTVRVIGEAAILNPDDANTSTTLNAHALENLPNRAATSLARSSSPRALW